VRRAAGTPQQRPQPEDHRPRFAHHVHRIVLIPVARPAARAQRTSLPSVACPSFAYRKPSPAGTQGDHVRGGCDAIARHRTLPVTVADGTSGGTVGIVCTSSRSDAEPGAGRSRHRSRQRRRQCSRMPCRTPCMSRCTGLVAAAHASSSPPRSLATAALPVRAAPLSFPDIVAERRFRMDSLTRVKVLTPDTAGCRPRKFAARRSHPWPVAVRRGQTAHGKGVCSREPPAQHGAMRFKHMPRFQWVGGCRRGSPGNFAFSRFPARYTGGPRRSTRRIRLSQDRRGAC